MTDIWSFLLQTLTASGTAVLLLALKALFRDKLSPRWQFAVWGVLALVLIFPAGTGGRYALVNWPYAVELLKSVMTGEFGSLTQVTVPVPIPQKVRLDSWEDWLFLLYTAGVVFCLLRYLVSYTRLRLALRKKLPGKDAAVLETADRFGLHACPAIEVDGLPSAFICGVFRPVLALPAGEPADEKMLLHELLHLKYKDVLWGLLICLFRCIHWCNPLLWYCADLAGNDLESLCDQRVLERLIGEDRRDYGRILLSMADEKYARMPGTSSMANGGKNIRRRIEAIARFKRYPAGMAPVSVCVILSLTVPLLLGAKAQALEENHSFFPDTPAAIMVSARSVRCTTYAGALDAYAKALLKEYIPYRAMCAPLEEQNALMDAFRREDGSWEWKNSGLPGMTRMDSGYKIYNLTPVETDAYEGLLALELWEPPEGETATKYRCWLAVQTVRAEKQDGRWVVLPQEDFWTAESEWGSLQIIGGHEENLPAWEYQAETEDFALKCRWQTTAYVDSFRVNQNFMFTSTDFDCSPLPSGTFTSTSCQELFAYYTGTPENMDRYTHIAVSCCACREEEPRPEQSVPYIGDGSGSSTSGESWGSKPLENGWESPVFLSGGGGGGYETAPDRPGYYAADLYLNGILDAELTLLPVERRPVR